MLVRILLQRAAGNETKYRLIDVDGKDITPTELAEKYFSSPEALFHQS
jgi:hypothetical protein